MPFFINYKEDKGKQDQRKVFAGSRIIRRPGAYDVRLTTSDKVHNLIIQRAEDAALLVKAEARRKKQEKLQKKRQKWIGAHVPIVSYHKNLSVDTEVAGNVSEESVAIFEMPHQTSHASLKSYHGGEVSKLPETTPRKSAVRRKTPVIKKAPGGKVVRVGKSQVAPRMSAQQKRKSSVQTGLAVGKPPVSLTEITTKKTVSSQSQGYYPPDSSTDLFTNPASANKSILNTIWIEEIEKRLSNTESAAAIPPARRSIVMNKAKKNANEKPRRIARKSVKLRLKEIKKHLEKEDAPPKEEYHPYAHRKRPDGLTNCEAIALVIRSLLGSGILKMPVIFGFRNAYVSLVGCVSILVWISVCIHLYFFSRQSLCKRIRQPYMSFSETFKNAILIGPRIFRIFAYFLAYVIDIFLIYHQLIILMKYAAFVAYYSGLIFDGPETKIYPSIHIMPFLGVALIGMWIRPLKRIARISIAVNFLGFLFYSIVVFQMAKVLTSDRGGVQSVYKYPRLLFGAQTLAVADCLAAIICVEEHMKHPRLIVGLSGIVNLALMFSGLWYIMIGFFGHWHIGTTVTYEYLADMGFHRWLNVLLFYMYIPSMIVSYAVQAYIAIQLLWNYLCKKRLANTPYIEGWELLLRTFYGILPFLVLFLPKVVRNMIMFVGYIIGPFLTLSCPAIIHFCVCWANKRKAVFWFSLIFDIFLVALSICAILATVFWYIQVTE